MRGEDEKEEVEEKDRAGTGSSGGSATDNGGIGTEKEGNEAGVAEENEGEEKDDAADEVGAVRRRIVSSRMRVCNAFGPLWRAYR
jgi:hypothetical protein